MLKGGVELGVSHFSGEGFGEGVGDLADLSGGFVDEFEPEMVDTSSAPRF